MTNTDPTAGHSPIPWKHCDCGKCGLIWDGMHEQNVATAHDYWGDAGENPKDHYGRVGPEQRQANMRLIVRAVNHHDALVAALRQFESEPCEAEALRMTACWDRGANDVRPTCRTCSARAVLKAVKEEA